MKATCSGTHGCGAEWAGRAEHCTAPGCHRTFSGTRAADMHRTGDHAVFSGPDRRRCLTADEMLVKGLAPNEREIWGQAGQKPSFWQLEEESDGLADFDWGVTPERISQALLETPQREESA